MTDDERARLQEIVTRTSKLFELETRIEAIQFVAKMLLQTAKDVDEIEKAAARQISLLRLRVGLNPNPDQLKLVPGTWRNLWRPRWEKK